MEKDYKYELQKIIRNEYRLSKKHGEYFPINLKKEIDKLISNRVNNFKIELLYKNKFAFLNTGMFIPELEDIYIKLIKKILFTDEKSIIFKEWNNIFNNVFGNLPIIYNKNGIDFVNRVITLFCNTKDENKLKLLLKLFPKICNSNDINFVNLLFDYIENTKEEDILNSYETIIDNLYIINNNNLLSNNKEFILEQFSNSKSRYNSEMLSELLKIFTDKKREIINVDLINLFKIFTSFDNRELINAYYELMKDYNFTNADSNIQNRCIGILKHISVTNYLHIRIATRIILEIIVVNENKYIQDYLIEKLKHINNYSSLELILILTPLLNEFIDDEEYVRVVDSIEDKNNNITKKLIINLDN